MEEPSALLLALQGSVESCCVNLSLQGQLLSQECRREGKKLCLLALEPDPPAHLKLAKSPLCPKPSEFALPLHSLTFDLWGHGGLSETTSPSQRPRLHPRGLGWPGEAHTGCVLVMVMQNPGLELRVPSPRPCALAAPEEHSCLPTGLEPPYTIRSWLLRPGSSAIPTLNEKSISLPFHAFTLSSFPWLLPSPPSGPSVAAVLCPCLAHSLIPPASAPHPPPPTSCLTCPSPYSSCLCLDFTVPYDPPPQISREVSLGLWL